MEVKGDNYSDKNLLGVLKELEVRNPKDIDKFIALQLARRFSELSESAFETLFSQVPNFLNLLEEGLKAEKDIINKSLDNNAENIKFLSEKFDIVLETIKECQKKPDITFEESRYYIDRMYDVLVLISNKDTENKQFIEKNVKVISDVNNKNRNSALIILAGVAGVGLLALGVVTNNPYLTQEAIKKASGKVVEIADKKGLIK